MWLNSSLLFLPLCSFFSDWMCFIYSCGGCGGEGEEGRDEEERTGGYYGTSRHDERGLSLFNSPRRSSFQLFEASHQMGLNSRRDTICLSSTPSSLLLGISPTHPSILPSLPICFDSVLYLPATTGIHPPIHSLTMLLGDHWQEARVKEKKPKFTLSINIKASILLQTSYTSCLLHIQQEAHRAFYLMHHADSLLLWKEDSLSERHRTVVSENPF